MIMYSCDLCGTSHEADIGNRGIVYMDGAKVIIVDDKNKPCDSCASEIKKAEDEARARILAKRNGATEA